MRWCYCTCLSLPLFLFFSFCTLSRIQFVLIAVWQLPISRSPLDCLFAYFPVLPPPLSFGDLWRIFSSCLGFGKESRLLLLQMMIEHALPDCKFVCAYFRVSSARNSSSSSSINQPASLLVALLLLASFVSKFGYDLLMPCPPHAGSAVRWFAIYFGRRPRNAVHGLGARCAASASKHRETLGNYLPWWLPGRTGGRWFFCQLALVWFIPRSECLHTQYPCEHSKSSAASNNGVASSILSLSSILSFGSGSPLHQYLSGIFSFILLYCVYTTREWWRMNEWMKKGTKWARGSLVHEWQKKSCSHGGTLLALCHGDSAALLPPSVLVNELGFSSFKMTPLFALSTAFPSSRH